MNEKVKSEPYLGTNYVKCPNCGKETKIVERATDFTSYVIICKECGKRTVLSENEERKAKIECNEDRETKKAAILATLPQLRKKREKETTF